MLAMVLSHVRDFAQAHAEQPIHVGLQDKCFRDLLNITQKCILELNKLFSKSFFFQDVVITVPAYFTQAERIVVEQAAGIAGFNLLQVCF